MNLLVLIVVLTVCLAPLISGLKHALPLKGEDDFKGHIQNAPLTMVKFFSPDCHHCIQMAKDYENAAMQLRSRGLPLAEVDCTDSPNRKLCRSLNIHGYPTLRIYRHGTPQREYNGRRDAASIVDFMSKNARPPLLEIKDTDKLESLKKSDQVIVVGLFEEKVNAAFADVAFKLSSEILFAVAHGQVAQSIAEQVKASIPQVVLFNTHDDTVVIYDQAMYDKNALEAFVQVERHPIIHEMTSGNLESYVQSGLPLAVAFVQNDEQRVALKPVLVNSAKKFKKQVHFVFTDANQFSQYAEALLLPKDEFPSFAVHDLHGSRKYPFGQAGAAFNPTEQDIVEFVDKALKRELTPSMLSEPVPTKEKSPILHLVHDNFKSTLSSSTKDLVILFHSASKNPIQKIDFLGCRQCKEVLDIWTELTQMVLKLELDSKIVFSKFDTKLNDLPLDLGFEIQALPTVKIFKNNAFIDVNVYPHKLESYAKAIQEKTGVPFFKGGQEAKKKQSAEESEQVEDDEKLEL